MARAGAFRDRAQFERESQAGRDDLGNPTGAWGPLFAAWVDLRETPGRERIAAGRLEAPATGTLRLRASPAARGLTAQDRVRVRGATWAIVGAPIQADRTGAVLEVPVERGGATT